MNKTVLENYEELLKQKEAIDKLIYSSLEDIVNNDNSLKCNFDVVGKFICPRCSSNNTFKGGFSPQGKQRYKCGDCSSQRIIKRNNIAFSSKKDFSHWARFIKSMFELDSLKVSAHKASISQRTAFRWRHKVLMVLNKHLNKATLSGNVELDETLFPLVSKNKNDEKEIMQRAKRGISNQKINVACAIDEKGNTILQVSDVGRITSKSLIEIFSGKIEKGAIVISDSHRSYHKLMKELEVDWKKIPSKKKSLEQYTLETINHLHGLLKDFTYKYKGISVKYLQGYVAFFNYYQNNKNHYQDDVFKDILMTIFSTSSDLRCIDIDSGEPIYT